MPSFRRAGVAAAAIAVPAALAYRFALIYRTRAGYPRRHVLAVLPSDLGMAYEAIDVSVEDLTLPAWFILAKARQRGLGSSSSMAGNRLATGCCPTPGSSTPQASTSSSSTYGAMVRTRRRTCLSAAASSGPMHRLHSGRWPTGPRSLGSPCSATRWAASAPRSRRSASRAPTRRSSSRRRPTRVRLTRQTFRLARLHLPSPVAWPLAWLTTRVYIRPRHHAIAEDLGESGACDATAVRCCSSMAPKTASSRPRTTRASSPPPRPAERRDRSGAGGDPHRGGRRSQLALRGRGLPTDRRVLPRPGARRAAVARGRRGCRRGHPVPTTARCRGPLRRDGSPEPTAADDRRS